MRGRGILIGALAVLSPGLLPISSYAGDASGDSQPAFAAPLYLDLATSTSAPAAAPVAAPAVEPSAAPEESGKPLMLLMDKVGLGQSLRNAGIELYGRIEGSYIYAATNAARDFPGPGGYGHERVIEDSAFAVEDNVARLNQLGLVAERVVDFSSGHWDVGFRLETIYGSDARYIHANGLNPYEANNSNFQRDPLNQWDLFQAYLDIGVPVGNGLRVRLGKFEAIFGGTVDPNGNTFFSRTIFYSGVHPTTLTGVMLTYGITDTLFIDGGVCRGWDQAIKDNNGAVTGFMRGTWLLNDQTAISLAAIDGPEQPGDNSNQRTLIEPTLKYQANDRLHFILDGRYVRQRNDANAVLGTINQDVRGYGVSLYGGYTLSPQATFNARVEFVRDEEGLLFGFNPFTGTGARTIYETTVGLTLIPFASDNIGQNFKLRPELRMQYSQHARYDGLAKNDLITLAIDAIYNF